MDWLKERRKQLQVKQDRGHFGLAWSVLAAYAIALAVLLDGWHPRTRSMIDVRFVAIIVFMVVGGFGVYLALAAAFRIWPHNPRKRDVQRCEDVTSLYLDGHRLFGEWGELIVHHLVLYHDGALDDEALNRRDSQSLDLIQKIVDWKKRADQSIVEWFGESACRTFITEPEISYAPPDWQRGDQWFTNWNEIAGRLAWLRRWLLEQDDL